MSRNIEERKLNPTPESYTARMLSGGDEGILEKAGEEAVKAILASKMQEKQRLVEVIADLVFRALVLLTSKG